MSSLAPSRSPSRSSRMSSSSRLSTASRSRRSSRSKRKKSKDDKKDFSDDDYYDDDFGFKIPAELDDPHRRQNGNRLKKNRAYNIIMAEMEEKARKRPSKGPVS